MLIHIGNDEEKRAWAERIVTIKDISELGQAELEALPEGTMIRIVGVQFDPLSPQQELYTKEKYEAILANIEERFGSIPPAIKGNPASELQTFLAVFHKFIEIAYDEYATTDMGDNDELLQITCRNLEGGLLDGRCVCAGYAEILRNVLATKNIEAKLIDGGEIEDGKGHAWNQVKIGGVWYNTDVTWERDKMLEVAEYGEKLGPEVLKTDKEFSDHDCFCHDRSKWEEKCDIPITEVLAGVEHKPATTLEGQVEQAQEIDLVEQIQGAASTSQMVSSDSTNKMKNIRQMREQKAKRKPIKRSEKGIER